MTEADERRLEKKCDKMAQTLTEVRDWQIRFDGRAEQIARDVDELRGDMYGNGSPGVKARLQRQEDNCKVHLAEQSWIKKFICRVAQTVTAVVIVTVMFWLMGLFKAGK